MSFIQRFTQDLRLFPHVHVLLPEGVFTLPDGEATELSFHALPPPPDSDVRSLTERLAERLQTVAQRHLERIPNGEDAPADDALVRSCADAAECSVPARRTPPVPKRRAAPKPLYPRAASMLGAHTSPLNQEQWRALRDGLGRIPGPADNDGMVPVLSQVYGDVVHAACADHLDVIGHSGDASHAPPHVDWLITGAKFDRRHFERLWGEVPRYVAGETA